MLGLTYCTKQVYSKLRQHKAVGHIININSVAGHYVNGNDAILRNLNVYPSSKHAVTVLTEIIRRELIIEQNKDVRVTVKIRILNVPSISYCNKCTILISEH